MIDFRVSLSGFWILGIIGFRIITMSQFSGCSAPQSRPKPRLIDWNGHGIPQMAEADTKDPKRRKRAGDYEVRWLARNCVSALNAGACIVRIGFGAPS